MLMNDGRTKKCKVCRNFIPRECVVCPNCGTKQSGNLKWTIITFVVFVVALGSFVTRKEENNKRYFTEDLKESHAPIREIETEEIETYSFVKKETEEEIEEETEEEIEESLNTKEKTDEFSYDDMIVKYIKHEVMVDEIDQTVVVVYYRFTNKSAENKTFDYSFDDTCFQNGIEIEGSWWHANEESKNSNKEIKSGTTITVASSFVLGENRDDVELEITPWMRDEILFKKILKLN